MLQASLLLLTGHWGIFALEIPLLAFHGRRLLRNEASRRAAAQGAAQGTAKIRSASTDAIPAQALLDAVEAYSRLAAEKRQRCGRCAWNPTQAAPRLPARAHARRASLAPPRSFVKLAFHVVMFIVIIYKREAPAPASPPAAPCARGAARPEPRRLSVRPPRRLVEDAVAIAMGDTGKVAAMQARHGHAATVAMHGRNAIRRAPPTMFPGGITGGRHPAAAAPA